MAKKQILDSLAAIVGGSSASLSGELEGLVELVRDWGGKAESSILGFGGRVPAPEAAFINGVLCTRLDYDDTFTLMVRNHPSRSIVPVAMAVAERQGTTNGKQLLNAVVLGIDLECRIKLGVGRDIDSPFGFIHNFLGATATAGKLLGLNKEKLKSAHSIAFHQISGAQGGTGTAGSGASLKGINNGVAARTGVFSALLATKGFSANSDFLDSDRKNNLYGIFYGGLYVPPLVIEDLGKSFVNVQTSQKQFPCCHGQAAALELTLSLIEKYHIQPGDVAKVQLYLSPNDLLLLADPIEKKQNPQNFIESQFSLCWGVASAIVYGKVGLKNFSNEALRDSRVRELAHKVSAKHEVSFAGHILNPCVVEIKTTSNQVYAMKAENPILGSPENPMSFSHIKNKFRQCCEISVKPIPEKNQNAVMDMVESLEEIQDVAEIARLLS
jgi:2-methylcitrate dehydratase PrpD